MKQFHIAYADIDTQAELEAIAIPLAKGNVIPVSATELIVQSDFIGGNEGTDDLVIDDSANETVIKGAQVKDAQAGYTVVGITTLANIEGEFRNYEIFYGVNDGGGTPKYLFRGVLKASKTEQYTPGFLSDINVQFSF